MLLLVHTDARQPSSLPTLVAQCNSAGNLQFSSLAGLGMTQRAVNGASTLLSPDITPHGSFRCHVCTVMHVVAMQSPDLADWDELRLQGTWESFCFLFMST